LLFIQRTGEKDYNPILKFGKEPINDLAPYKADFDKRLSETVDEIFNPDISFNPTTEQERCAYCPYKKLCSV
jgi:ATP-dependent helicase/DNAse subunit B